MRKVSAKRKPIEHYFRDWESEAFQYNYGTGEEHILPALKRFFELCVRGPNQESYNYSELEKELSPTVAWMLINVLNAEDLFEYGTSPRYAWLTDQGKVMKEFLASKSVNDLLDIVYEDDEDHVECRRDGCNCIGNDHQDDFICANPFWYKKYEIK